LAEQVLEIQKSVQLKLDECNAKYKATADKRRQKKIFEGDVVMVYLRRERICACSYNKLKPKKDDLFKIMKKISDNTSVVDLPSEMAMAKTFNVVDLYDYHPTKQLYPDDNSKMSSFEEVGIDVRDQEQQQTKIT